MDNDFKTRRLIDGVPLAWNAEECARQIGRTRHAVYCLVNRKAIPFHKPDGRLQFIPDEIRAWLGNVTYSTSPK